MRMMMAFIILAGVFPIASHAQAAREEPVTQLPQWSDFSNRQDGAQRALQSCLADNRLCTTRELRRWADLIISLKGENPLRQMITVNRWFNRIPYTYDEYAYKTIDYWADTLQFLKSSGDCEDFALAKYYTLRELGFTTDSMKIMMVYDTEKTIDHSVLMVYMNDSRYLLDNYSDDTDPSSMEYRYKNVYGFNETTSWFY